ncbi:MAG: putative Co/Zn/Cd efflux system rane fusion protein [Myxococcaceae bacterium]|nr:putative Co/Zn/Cd efflux system rane fusion protein [Myxococcaceae bacterium]
MSMRPGIDDTRAPAGPHEVETSHARALAAPAGQSSSVTAPPQLPASTTGAKIAVAVGLIAALGLAGMLGVRVKQALGKKESLATERVTAQAAAQAKVFAKVAHPEPTQYRPRVEVTGTLRPWRDADVGFELGGRLVRVLVATGENVKSGQTLAVLDGSSAAAQVSQAEAASHANEAQLALAEDTLRRTEALVATKSIPEAQAEQARHQVALARAQLEGARASTRLAKTGAGEHAIVAPFPGLVTKAPTAAGGVVQPGAPLVHIEDLSKFRLSATVNEEDVLLLKPGSAVTITSRDQSVIGRVTTVVPSLDQATRRAPIEVEVPNDPKTPLLAWSFVRATLDAGMEVPALKVPANARRPGSQNELIKVEGGRARITRVVRAIDTDGSWLVRQGLVATDVVLLDADPETKDGDLITVSP